MKRFEKSLVEHIASRASVRYLIRSLIDPNIDVPAWFSNSLTALQQAGVSPSVPHDIKDYIRTLPATSQQALIDFANLHISAFVEGNASYSAAMASVALTRKTATVEPMVVDKYTSLRIYFIRLFAILMDVYVLARYLSEKPAEIAVVAGLAHTSRIMEFLIRTGVAKPTSTMSVQLRPDGSLDMDATEVDTSIHVPLAIVKPYKEPVRELHDFRNRRRVA